MTTNPVSEPTDAAWAAISGAVDLHVHVAPDIIGRKYDDVALAEEFRDAGLGGFLLKSHYVPTAERAAVVRRAVPDVKCYGGIVLNHGVGGINPVAVDIAGRSGARMVWFPTVDAKNEESQLGAGMKFPPLWVAIKKEMLERGIDTEPALEVLDEAGGLTARTMACLESIKEHDMVLATGHLGRDEIFALVKEARAIGIERVLITHAEFPSEDLSAEEQKALAEMGAVIEHCFTTAYTEKCTWDAMFANIAAVGASQSLISSDLGQPTNPDVSVGLAMFADLLMGAGFSAAEVHQLAAEVPAALID